MKAKRTISGMAALVVAMAMGASGVNSIWLSPGVDTDWFNAANWQGGITPAGTNVVINWTGKNMVLDGPDEIYGYWSKNLNGNTLFITSNGVLQVADYLGINQWSYEWNNAAMQVDGGSVVVGTNLCVAGMNASQGEASLVLNSGSIIVSNNVQIGTIGQGLGVDGVLTLNGGSVTVSNHTILGGGNLATDEGTLNLYGGVYTESSLASTNPAGFQIGIGPGSGTVNLYGGSLVNNHALQMESGESNDVGTATINVAGGEWWQMDPSVDIQDQGTINFQAGTFYWSGNQIAALSDLVASSNVTYELGLTNMLTESWDASWSNAVTLDYGYWSKSYGTALYADYNDVTNGFTAIWAYNLSPAIPPAVSDGVEQPHYFSNVSGDQLWTTPANWDIGSVPTEEDAVYHTGLGTTLVVADAAAATNLYVSSGATSTLAVVTYGSLSIGGNVEIGNAGDPGEGKLLVDGGDVDIAGTTDIGLYGTDRKGVCEVNSGTLDFAGAVALGGWNEGATGEMTVNGGTVTQAGVFTVGRTGNGTLTVNGGSLINSYSSFNGLTINSTGTVIVNGGLCQSTEANVSGKIYLNGGTFRTSNTYQGAFKLNSGSLVTFDKGIFQGGWDHRTSLSTKVADGKITWTNGLDTMLYENPDLSWTNGASSFHVYFDGGQTYAWAYKIPAPVDPPGLSIAKGLGGGLDIAATNLYLVNSYELQTATSLSTPSWSSVSATTGVSEATWNVPITNSTQFFRIEEL